MNMKHELVADIPLIIGFCKQINLLSIIDKLFSNPRKSKRVIKWSACSWLDSSHVNQK